MSKFKFHSEITIAEAKDLKGNCENKINELLRELRDSIRLPIGISTITDSSMGEPDIEIVNLRLKL